MEKYIIYDEKCVFCTKFSMWSTQQNPSIIAISVRSRDAKSILREKGIRFIDLQTIYYLDHRGVFNRSKAVFQIFRCFKFPYRLISLGGILPKTFTDYIYNIFAKYRYMVKI
ncbi:DCC1-like thiol-disulfide oxidoreductase family protein [Riemerella columbina]|uniref:DCC1-like thiol-disulfide oxidoreductase family protein n=1 Tax=Riemerella columbina TaxID=103810 RepID=UPI000477D704